MADDTELLKRACHGDGGAFEELVQRHGRYLFGVAHALTGNAFDAEDVVQETLLASLRGKYRGEAAVRTWLVGILVKQAARTRRSRRKHEALPGDLVSSGNESNAAGARMDLTVMLASLSAEHRTVIVLRELEGMSYEEMAGALGVPRGTVESRLYRAREELRRRWGKSEG